MRVTAWPAFKTKYKNPYNWLLYSHMQQQGIQVDEFSMRQAVTQRYDICHLHWPVETIVRCSSAAAAWGRAILMLRVLDWMRLQGTRIVWTIHDQTPHSVVYPKIARWFQNNLTRRIDGCISLCEASQTLFEASSPSLKARSHAVIPHGHYREVYPKQIGSATAKAQLEIPENESLLLFLGYIDYYKNVPALIRAFKALDEPDWCLLIAGKVEVPALREEIIQLAAGDDRIRLQLKFIPDDHLQTYFQAADLVALPFTEILNSGSTLLALSFDRPVLVPHQGALVSLQEAVGSAWMKLYETDLTPTVLASGLQWAKTQSRPTAIDLSAFDWSVISQQTVSFYQTLRD